MKRISIVLISMVAVLACTSCVSQGDYESVQAELTTCQEEKAQAEAQVIIWEQRFDRESDHWKALGATISEQVPRALSELDAERDRIVKLVPQQVQGEVEAYLDEYFTTVMQGFDQLSKDNNDVKLQLEATQKVLMSLGSDTRAVSEKIDTTLTDERDKRGQEERKRHAVASRISQVVATITEFNNTQINCKQCPEKLKLNRKQREAVTAFHGELTNQLAQVQSFAASEYEIPTEEVAPSPLGEGEGEGESAEGDGGE